VRIYIIQMHIFRSFTVGRPTPMQDNQTPQGVLIASLKSVDSYLSVSLEAI